MKHKAIIADKRHGDPCKSRSARHVDVRVRDTTRTRASESRYHQLSVYNHRRLKRTLLQIVRLLERHLLHHHSGVRDAGDRAALEADVLAGDRLDLLLRELR